MAVPFSHPVSLRRFVDYGCWVQRHGVSDLDTRRVTGLGRDSDGFALELSDGAQLKAGRVVVACGIAPFERIPEHLRDLPGNLASHTGHHDDLSIFAVKRLAIVGSGQSALECAVLAMERGAEVEIIGRRSEMTWLRNRSPSQFLGPMKPLIYAPTDVGPLWYSRLVAAPALFRGRLPQETQDRIAYRSIRPACSHFVKVRIDGIKLTMGTEATAADPIGGGVLGHTLTDGTQREVDHLMFGTGYKVDVTRYPFLSEGLLSELRVVDGYPASTRGFETSVPRLHMLGAPAARSFSGLMRPRFVLSSWYAGTRLASALAPARRRVPSGYLPQAASVSSQALDLHGGGRTASPAGTGSRHVGRVPTHFLRGIMIRCNDWRLDRLATTPSEKADSPHWRCAPSNVCSSALVAAWLAM